MSTRKLMIQKIHIAKSQMKISDNQYRDLLQKTTGVASCSVMTEDQLLKVLSAMESLGFTKKAKRMPVQEGDVVTPNGTCNATSRQIYYIKGLWELASRKKDESSLRSMLHRIVGVDDVRFLNRTHASRVIRALREMAQQAGFDPDGPTRR